MQTRRFVRILQATTASTAAGYGVMFAVLAKIRDTYNISETMLGVIVGIGFFTGFLSQLFIAPFADRGFAKRLLVVGTLLNVVGLAILAASSSAPGFLTGRALMGFGAGMVSPSTRRIVALLAPDDIGRNQGALLSADVTGFLIGPALAAVLVGPFGLRVPFVVASVICLVLALIVSTIPADDRAEAPTEPHRLALDLLRTPWMQAACCYGVAFFVMIGLFDALWAVRITDLNGSDLYVTVGIIVFALPLVFLGQRGGAFVERHGPFRTGAIGLLIGAFCVSLYGLIPVPPILVLVGCFHATNDAYTASSIPVSIAMAAPPERLASAQGLVGAAQTLVGGLGSVAAGAAYDHYGPVRTYLGGALVMTLFVLVGWSRARSFGIRAGSGERAVTMA